MQTWRPAASLSTLQLGAQLRACIREYMERHGVLEVVTPAMSQAAATDPNIHSFAVADKYLHTSPEFPMKRLLSAYNTDIYQLCSVFRDGESGAKHNPEFTLLEWYRIGFDHTALMHDVEQLMMSCAALASVKWIKPITLRYTDELAKVCGQPFEQITTTNIQSVFESQQRSYPEAIADDFDAACDLLMDEFVIREFQDDQPVFIVDYPASQAALAKTYSDQNGLGVAARFELFWGQVELANGFYELSDAVEQRRRFEHDTRVRQSRGQVAVPMDEHLLSALDAGFPDCAGVALGIDRLLMKLTNAKSINEVVAFPVDRA